MPSTQATCVMGLRRAVLAMVYSLRDAGGVFPALGAVDDAGRPPADTFQDLQDLTDVLAIATAGLGLITLALWMAWSSRVESNAPMLGTGEGTIGPAGRSCPVVGAGREPLPSPSD